jgi:hypothetical protein
MSSPIVPTFMVMSNGTVRHTSRHASSSSRKRRHTNRSKRSKPHHYRKAGKRIHYTKRGQPYIITAHGKARFISRKSARIDKKRKGGYY